MFPELAICARAFWERFLKVAPSFETTGVVVEAAAADDADGIAVPFGLLPPLPSPGVFMC